MAGTFRDSICAFSHLYRVAFLTLVVCDVAAIGSLLIVEAGSAAHAITWLTIGIATLSLVPLVAAVRYCKAY